MAQQLAKYSLSASVRLRSLKSSVAVYDEKYANTHILDRSFKWLLEFVHHDSLTLGDLVGQINKTKSEVLDETELSSSLEALIHLKILVNKDKSN
jgi:hypothetical protein